MNSTAFRPSLPSSLSLLPTRPVNHLRRSQPSQFKPLSINSLRSLEIPNTPKPIFSIPKISTVNDKLQILIYEFKSLSEPIDRVKRLLHYANLLPKFDESGRVELNRVTGCTAQVWLEVKLDREGAMRFRVDSDSEITKGFCFCLIWLLDGAKPEEVLEVEVDDLGDMNVGILPIRANSRVNTWHNVLISMQRRTKDFVLER